MWPSDSPPPIVGMPWRSIQVMNELSSRAMMSKQWSVPRWSCHMSIGATGCACSSTGTTDEYCVHTPIATTRPRRVGVRARDLVHRVDEQASTSLGVLLGGLAVADRRRAAGCALATSVPSASTSATFTLVVPISMPMAAVMPASCLVRGRRAAIEIVRASNGSVSWCGGRSRRRPSLPRHRARPRAPWNGPRRDRDLTLAQYRVLALIAAGDERSTLLATGLAVAKPTITAVVDGLVERGFIERGAVDGDRRSIRLGVTKAGTQALRGAEREMAAALERILGFG